MVGGIPFPDNLLVRSDFNDGVTLEQHAFALIFAVPFVGVVLHLFQFFDGNIFKAENKGIPVREALYVVVRPAVGSVFPDDIAIPIIFDDLLILLEEGEQVVIILLMSI